MALTRWTHENAVRLKGEMLTEADKAWYRTVNEHMCLDYVNEHVLPTPDSDPTASDFRPVNPDACLDALAASLSPEMGKPSRRGRSKLRCTRHLGDWRIVTEFTFWRKRMQEDLSFVYQFIRKDGGPVLNGHPAQGPFPRSMLLFYGISNSSVAVPAEKHSEPMARAIAKLAEYFVLRADPLFQGLGIND